MAWYSVGVTAVGAIGNYVASSKQKAPATAAYTPVDVAEEQRKALAGNLANFDDAATLASKGNSFQQAETARLLEQALPGFGALQKRLLASANSDLDAQTTLPADVQQQIQRYAAEKGITRGTSGNFNSFNLLKDFGFNLVDWQQASRARALNTLQSVYGMAPKINVMSPMSFMVDPTTAIQAASRSADQQYNIAQADNNAQAAAYNQRQSQLGGLLQGLGNAAAYGIRQQAIQPKATTTAPAAKSGLGLLQTYQPLAGARATFAAPATAYPDLPAFNQTVRGI